MGGVPTTPGGADRRVPALRFADAAKRLGAATRAAGLVVPAFRCPPRVPGVRRTVRRYPGGAVVSVVLRDRPWDEIAGDLVEGVVVVNRLQGEAALRLRTALLESIDASPAAPARERAARHPEAA